MKLLACLLVPMLSFAQPKPDTTLHLFNNKVELLSSKLLTPMSSDMWRIKYHTLPRPELVLTDEAAKVNLLVDMTTQALTDSRLEEYKNMRTNKLKQSRNDVKILAEGIKTVNGKRVGFVKFSSQATDQGIFNYYFFTIVGGKVVVFTFNCIQKLQATWEPVADAIMQSLKVAGGK